MSRGQYLTKSDTLKNIVFSLVENTGRLLEPSAGQGDLIEGIESEFDHVDAFEIDERLIDESVCKTEIKHNNFLSVPLSSSYDTIIGNPPYLKNSKIEDRDKFNTTGYFSYPKNGNLYYYFIERSIKLLKNGGELIFIVPKDFFWSESAIHLRPFIYKMGSFTHFIQCEDRQYFKNASLESLCIFRYERGYNRRWVDYYSTPDAYRSANKSNKFFDYFNNLFYLSDNKTDYIGSNPFSNYFNIHIGNVVSGKDSVYSVSKSDDEISERYKEPVITSSFEIDYLINVEHITDIEQIEDESLKEYLLENKEALISRGIKNFTEADWWKWGCLKNTENTVSENGRILIHTMTRRKRRASIDNTNRLVSASLIVMVPIHDDIDLRGVVEFINSDNFVDLLDDFQMRTGTKSRISVKTLRSLPCPIIENQTERNGFGKFFDNK